MSLPNRQNKLANVLAAFWEEISPKVDAYAIPEIQTKIEEWVGKDPELTEVLCKYAVQYAPHMSEGVVGSVMDKAIYREILQDWESSLAASHLNKVRDALLRHDRRDSLLIIYIQILQRGEVRIDDSPEQLALIEAGLVQAEGSKLKVANKLYAEVFDLAWIERQIPGITKPVTIVSPHAASNSVPSASAKLYSKLAIAACGLAVVGAAISSYIRESGGEAMAIPEERTLSSAQVENPSNVSEVIPQNPISQNLPSQNPGTTTEAAPTEISVRPSDRELFDSGEEHAKSSRWVLMMRDFCAIAPESAYFISAQKDLERWKELYPEDLNIAIEIVSAEEGGQCTVVE